MAFAGLERRLLATCRWHVATAVAFPQKSESVHQLQKFNMGEFPSGQRGQTVNLLAMPSVVRIHLPPPKSEIRLLAWLGFFVCMQRWIRKPALGKVPAAPCNRRGFSAEKRICLPLPSQKSLLSTGAEVIFYCHTHLRQLPVACLFRHSVLYCHQTHREVFSWRQRIFYMSFAQSAA